MAVVDNSWLFVPAIEKYLEGTAKDCAQNIIYDLEDSLKEGQKEPGLKMLVNVLSRKNNRQHIYVRINRGESLSRELAGLKECGIDGIVIPKFEGSDILDEYGSLLGKRKIIALIESPAGIIHLEDFAQDSRLYGLAFGGEDFCSCLGVEVNDSAVRYAREKIVLWAAYGHKIALDTVCFEIKDMAVFRKKVEASLMMGFQSRLLIHPKQVDVIREINACRKQAELKKIIEIYEESSSGIVVIDDVVYERPHIERLKKILEQGGVTV